MKRLNQKHDVVIDTYYTPINTNAEQGEVTHHYTYVSNVYFYKRQIINDQEVFIKIEIHKEMILDLAAEINKIEKEVVNKPFNNLPF
jgi:hypothetical protein